MVESLSLGAESGAQRKKGKPMTKVHEACDQFLATWDRTEWMQKHGDWSDEGNCVEEGVIDPDDVSDQALALPVGRSLRGWQCVEGWRAHRVGEALYLNWWRTPDPSTPRRARDLWVLVDEAFFAESEAA